MPSGATTVFDGPVTVIGATGQQGGAVVDALVNQAVPVRAAFRWLAQFPAYQADFARTRELVPDVEDVPRWLARTDGRG